MDSKIVFDGMGNIIERNGVAIGSKVPLKRRDAIYVMRAHLEKRIRNSNFVFLEGTPRTVEFFFNGSRKQFSISSRKNLPESLSNKSNYNLEPLLAADFTEKIKFLGFNGLGAWYENCGLYYEIRLG